MKLGELRTIDEVDAPLALDVRTTVEHIIRVGMGVSAEPEIDRARMRGEVVLKGLRLRLIAEK